MKTAWKFLNTANGMLVSAYDSSPWVGGKWREEAAPVKACVGLNASQTVPDALRYVRGTILARVEYGGRVIFSRDKVTCERMRIVQAWEWGKAESVRLAAIAARSVLPIWNAQHDNDARALRAIEAAEAWLANPCETKRKAAYAAYADAYANAAYADAAAAAAYAAAAAAYAAAVADAAYRNAADADARE